MLAAPAMAALFFMIKLASEPSEPIITLESSAVSAPLATSPTVDTKTSETKPAELPINTSKDVLLPNESIETVPSAASLPAVNTDKKTGIATVEKTPQELASNMYSLLV